MFPQTKLLYSSLRFAVSFDLNVARISVEYSFFMHDHNIYWSSCIRLRLTMHIFPQYFVYTVTICLQCEKQNACVTSFRSADPFLSRPRLPPEEVSARLKFWARGPLILRLQDKNYECCACPKKWVRVPKFN